MSTYTVINVSLMNHDTHREVKCTNNNVFLATFDFLVAVNATVGSNVMGGLDTSGIDDTKAGSIFSPSHPSDDGIKDIMQLFKHALQFPFVEVIEDGVKPEGAYANGTPF